MNYWRNGDKPHSVLHYLALVFLAFSSQIKATYFLVAIVVLSFMTVDELFLKKRHLPISLLLFAAGWCGFWILAGQSLVDAPAFFATTFSYSNGYSAVAGATLNEIKAVEIIFCATALFILGSVAFYLRRERTVRGWVAGFCLSGLFFLVYRAAFTRQDHDAIGTMMTAVFSIYLIPLFLAFPGRRFVAVVIVLLVFILGSLGYVYSGNGVFDRSALSFYARIAQPFYFATSPQAAFWMRLVQRKNPQAYVDARARLQAYYTLPPMAGSVDIYPNDSALIISNGYQYAPRPVFQSQGVFSEDMERINAAYLRSAKAADYVMIRSNTALDGVALFSYYPSLLDGLSVSELLTRYEPYEAAGPYIILKKSVRPFKYLLDGPLAADFKIGTKVDLPKYLFEKKIRKSANPQPLLWLKSNKLTYKQL